MRSKAASPRCPAAASARLLAPPAAEALFFFGGMLREIEKIKYLDNLQYNNNNIISGQRGGRTADAWARAPAPEKG